jgi:hypothetical protein
LLENQPHDSICGCSVDRVHEEMRQRYDWVREIGTEIVRQSLRTIGALGPSDPLGTIAVFNPTPQPATSRVVATVPWNTSQPFVAAIAPDDERIPLALIGNVQQYVIPDGAPAGYDAARAEVGFMATDVPGYGYKIYRLVTGESSPAAPREDDGRIISNEFFEVEVSPEDGTLTVHERAGGRVLRGLNRFVDGGDRGDEYNYCVPEEDLVIDRPAQPPRIRRRACEGFEELSIELTYRLPAGLAADRRSRSTATCDERITSTVTLTAGVPRVDVSTTVFNAAEDHRLRVHFPSGIRTDVSKADQHFGVIKRPIALPPWDPATWAEEPIGTYPQKAFVSVDDGVAGLTIANRGLPEYEALDAADGVTIAVTLLRCVGWLSRADLSSRRGGAGPQLRTPGAQMHGRHTFDYSIIPHTGDWAAAGAHVVAVQHQRPMQARWNRRGLGHIDYEGSLVKVESPAFAVSAIKRAEDGDGVVVRLYNTLDAPAETQLDVPLAAGRVSRINLNEEHVDDIDRDEDGAEVGARQNEIVSLRFRR